MGTRTGNNKKKFTPAGIVFALLGLLLFSYFVWRAGVGDIVGGVERLGAGFLLVAAIAGMRKVVRALAWMECFDDRKALRFRDAFVAVLAADAMGTVMPLGMMVSEPAKAALVRKKAPLMSGLSAIAIENLFYSLSVALFVFCGMAVMLFSFPLPKPLRIASVCALIAVPIVLVVVYIGIKKRWHVLSKIVGFLHGRGIAASLLESKRAGVRTLEDQVFDFYGTHTSRFFLIMVFEACFHFAGVLEAWVTLSFINGWGSTGFVAAFILESVNRIITVVFKFIPLRLGVDEWGSGSVTRMLQLGTASGVILAVVRKGRDILWTAIGAALLVQRGLSLSKVAEEAEQAEIGLSTEPVSSEAGG